MMSSAQKYLAVAVFGMMMAIAGCCHEYQRGLAQCQRELAECQKRDHVVPGCASCTVTWVPGTATATMTVLGMQSKYVQATIMTDPGTANSHEYLIPLPVSGLPMSAPLSPAPGAKPQTALLKLYYKVGGSLIPDTVTSKPFVIP